MEKSKLEKWLNTFSIESGDENDFRVFTREAESELKTMAQENGFVLHKFTVEFYSFTAILKDVTVDGVETFVYVVIPDVRDSQKWWTRTVYRIIDGNTHGMNNFCTWVEVGKSARNLVDFSREGKS